MNTTIRNYEALYIIDANSTNEQVSSSISKFSDIITGNGGEIQAAGKWDKRRLAYEIKGCREGIYILIYFTGESAVFNELDRIFRISDDILRHIILRVEPEHIDTKKLEAMAERDEAAANEAASAPEEAAAADVPETTEAAPAAEEVTEVTEPAEPVEAPAQEAQPQENGANE